MRGFAAGVTKVAAILGDQDPVGTLGQRLRDSLPLQIASCDEMDPGDSSLGPGELGRAGELDLEEGAPDPPGGRDGSGLDALGAQHSEKGELGTLPGGHLQGAGYNQSGSSRRVEDAEHTGGQAFLVAL